MKVTTYAKVEWILPTHPEIKIRNNHVWDIIGNDSNHSAWVLGTTTCTKYDLRKKLPTALNGRIEILDGYSGMNVFVHFYGILTHFDENFHLQLSFDKCNFIAYYIPANRM